MGRGWKPGDREISGVGVHVVKSTENQLNLRTKQNKTTTNAIPALSRKMKNQVQLFQKLGMCWDANNRHLPREGYICPHGLTLGPSASLCLFTLETT